MSFAMQPDPVQQILEQYWGFDSFLPLQREAIQSVLDNRDSLVVMPTGGGKSLCYQAPALCTAGVAIVVSPLLALMKDQVDGLVACGVPAAAVNSTHDAGEKRRVAQQVESGELRLLYMSPERLVTSRTLDFLSHQNVSFFAIDEAHCISAWGHDFRPEYRALRTLRERFPNVAVHAYTATATDQVRRDIVEQLGLREPEVLVGDFHRPNLQYHVARRERGLGQLCQVIDRFRDQSGIVYCITRAEVDRTTALLRELGYSALPYHAGMSDDERIRNQDAFLTERVNTIVATVAFGMGIDKSNVRYVVHSGMPKSLEHYQQESGRAGRDGVEAECHLLFSGRDLMTWKRLLSDLPDDARDAASTSLEKMNAYATAVTCRHKMLVEHFDQPWTRGSCNACDVCLGSLAVVDDALVIGQKILSCVLRLEQRFGADYVSQVLVGSQEQRILAAGHEQLSTWGLLRTVRRQDVRQWIEQLVSQGFLRKEGEYNTVEVTAAGRQLLRGEQTPTLLQAAKASRESAAKAATDSWEGVDQGLFDALRQLRREIASERAVPAYIVFGDATLREMARQRPSTPTALLDVRGVGQQKLADFGKQFVDCIGSYCQSNHVPMDVAAPVVSVATRPRAAQATPSASAVQAFELFDEGLSVEQVAERLGRAASTVFGYLESYVRHRRVRDVSPWLDRAELDLVEAAVQDAGAERLRPIFDALGGRVSYEHIRIAVACIENITDEQAVHEMTN
ncbi:MAG TPA: DNA helicase RecQ [Lacipirellulaceae bacterium]|jgi:ATP-dependent DNA helicase RecQ|nr:DNA helicase RecQ [Lacipirellulaceae bacterium]